jgi:hypothetical protein
LQNRRLTNRRTIQTPLRRASKGMNIRRYLYLRIRIYGISYASNFPNKIFCQRSRSLRRERA